MRAQTLADARREKLDADRLRAARPRPARRPRASRRCTSSRPTGRTCRCSCSPGFDDERRGVQAVAAGRAGLSGQGPDRRPGARARGPLRGRAPARRRGAPAARGRAAARRGERPPRARPAAGAAGHATRELQLTAHYRPGPPARAARRRLLRRGAGRRRHRARRDRRRLGPRAGRGRARRLPADRLARRSCSAGHGPGRGARRRCRSSTTHERHFSWMFTTLCDGHDRARPRDRVSIRLAGHPPPLLLVRRRRSTSLEPRAGRPAAGRRRRRALDRASSTRCPSAGRCCSTPTG